MTTKTFRLAAVLTLAAASLTLAPAQHAHADNPTNPSPDTLALTFSGELPQSAKPQTWWHWLNGNVTREGITADLEAMKRVGIGGAEIFNVDQGIPLGKAPMMSPQWFEMVKFAESEAKRLGLDLCIHNAGGWSSSGGPWIKPENSMQQVVTSAQPVTGGTHFSAVLPTPPTKANFYRDIAVIAVPALLDGVAASSAGIADLRQKADYDAGRNISPVATSDAPPASFVPVAHEIDLTSHMTADGHLDWDAPAGNWTVLRFGYTVTGAMNEPSPQAGLGLECDKLSKAALDVHFAGMVQKVLDDAGPLAGKNGALNDVLIDSYEVGSQNWTPAFREEFKKRRGYDLTPYLPVLAGRIVENAAVSERFLWDFRRTITDLFTENYYGHFAELCHARGLKFSTEAYGNGPFDELACGGAADIPMAEFWVGGAAEETAKLASSSGHTYGRTYIGAESFTSEPSHEKGTVVPADLKAQGDRMFCAGINRFIFHRYAMQPWVSPRRAPGMTMGPWGIHFERTNTWWNQGAAWLSYVGRAQYLLQQGTFIADVAYFSGDNAPIGLQTGEPAIPAGYDYDGLSQELLRDQMTVKDGMLALPSGMRYRVLVLPRNTTMTPETLRKIRQLVSDGATVVGMRPQSSPSLQNYPACDDDVRKMADELWGPIDGKTVTEHIFGKGRVVASMAPEVLTRVLREANVAPDCLFETAGRPATGVHFIHRQFGDTDAYFVASQWSSPRTVHASFRVGSDRTPYLYHADTGAIEPTPVFQQDRFQTTITMHFDPTGSVFVVFEPHKSRQSDGDHLVRAEFVATGPQANAPRPTLIINHATYGPVEGEGGQADVTARVAAQIEDGTILMPTSNDALGGDPAVNRLKRLQVEYTLNGVAGTLTVAENGTLEIENPLSQGGSGLPENSLHRAANGTYSIEAWKPASLDLQRLNGSHVGATIPAIPDPLAIDGPWTLNFPPNLGAPASVMLPTLASWTDNADAGVRYFSGTATYVKDIDIPAALLGPGKNLTLDLGQIKNIAQVRLNGVDLGILWKPPYRTKITRAAHVGTNHLEIQITNLWVNRLIGDAQLPDDADWDGDHLRSWPQWLLDGKSSPTGHIAFTTWKHWKKDDPLFPSGLLGPVRLLPSVVVEVK